MPKVPPHPNTKLMTTVLFDLDGTLLDTAPTLTTILNYLLCKRGKSPTTTSSIRAKISQGITVILSDAFNIPNHNNQLETLRSEFLLLYTQQLTKKTQLFPGVQNILHQLDNNKISWGIVTNKPRSLSESLIKHFQFNTCSCLVTSDDVTHKKPNPEPLLYACKLMHTQPKQTLYIGDAWNDFKAAQSAQMPVRIVEYGYDIFSKQQYDQLIAGHHLIKQPSEILKLITNSLIFC